MPLSQCYQQQWAASRGSLAHLQGVNCCVSDLCNRPNPADDNSTQVFDVPAAATPTISCFTSTNATAQGMPAVQSLQYNSTVATWRPVNHSSMNNGTYFNATSNTTQFYSPAQQAPPASYGIPAPFSVVARGGGRCEVSAVPVVLFGGTAELYVHVKHAGNGDAWLEVWGRALEDMDKAAAAALFGPSGWSRNVVKFVDMLDRKKQK
ncbi:hypothetical protein OEZ85_013302 [Tetradesmus obliquus]|uniref:Uncharacterized protein n=1 Tax=Tetradesmus obliquus TaxID=3088 RepID=A0ABY8U6A3_TETOB|nr:hypothetical protein OEZ85_013302 [Tetradesmus obliquus]